jgi:hypothetical protein
MQCSISSYKIDVSSQYEQFPQFYTYNMHTLLREKFYKQIDWMTVYKQQFGNARSFKLDSKGKK